MKDSVAPVLCLALATLFVACGDATSHQARPGPPPARSAREQAPTPARPVRPPEPFERLVAAGRAPLELSAVAVLGHPPLPTYRATIRNLSDRPIRRVIATAVYYDVGGRALPGENQDVAFGSPLKAIDPGATLETAFLSRVDSASGVRFVVRTVIFLENGPAPDPAPRPWENPRYGAELARAEARR